MLAYLEPKITNAGDCRDTQAVIGAATGLSVDQVSTATSQLAYTGRLLVDRPDIDTLMTPCRYRLAER